MSDRTDRILTEVAALRATQDRTRELTRPMGTGSPAQLVTLKMTNVAGQFESFAGVTTWGSMLTTKCAMACASTGDDLRGYLLELAALAVAAVETIDRVAQIEEADRG